ncbi:MAG TPA: dihydrolipoyl dehydrogenase [Vicinamibacterales bacterium]|jgi:dihydrolipoamide dehydrogenase|nr:dihydrolipoyl dehydrogenase [Vicinamibacterales bacterium]
MADRYDLLVIGSGTGGYVAAIRAAQLGLSTAVVERQPVLGGTCLNWGCIPTKALLEHAHALKIAQDAGEWGITLGSSAAPAIDMARVHARKQKIVGGLTKGVEFLFKKNKIDWIKGTARLAGGGRVEIAGDTPRTIAAAEIVVATGSAPRGVAGVTIDRTSILTSDEAINLAEIPRSIAILGSGAVGVEFASIFRRFGSDVTVIELAPRLVPNEDEAVSTELARAFTKRGIHVRTSTTVTSAAVTNGSVRIVMESASGQAESLVVDKLLVAVGRAPVTDGLGVEDAGLALDRGFIVVDAHYRTNVPGISAIGDVITMGNGPHPQLAHVSSAEGVRVAERIAGRDAPPIDYDQVPACTYCDPEIGSVGLTEAEAKARGYDVRVGTFPFSALGRARIAGETDGFVKIVGEARYDQLLGVHIIGGRATELVAEAAAALRLEATVDDLVRTIHAHPTMSEAVGEAAHALHGGAINL